MGLDITTRYRHPGTAKMKEVLSAGARHFGHVHCLNVAWTLQAATAFAILWALNYQIPDYVTGLPEATLNSEGIILACNTSLHWEKETKATATFYCSFLSHVSMDLTVCGSCGSIRVADLEGVDLGTEGTPSGVSTTSEALMVHACAQPVKGIRSSGGSPDNKWPQISRKTQPVLAAVRRSIDICFRSVYLKVISKEVEWCRFASVHKRLPSVTRAVWQGDDEWQMAGVESNVYFPLYQVSLQPINNKSI
ncbi:hypothetical protein Cgig2_028110 [Carnegiea gigantea]|uniref:Uncharacterized protein n=1 Tax=Carnegiea gigantea TaxID=171969 RepID=A0A9Q1KIN1_9CARY|nr:hypothetical protein Cgig2_028110 [Carnegiea gigantea]